MTTELDRRIAEALAGQDDTLPEPGYFKMIMSLFYGPQGWMTYVIAAVQLGMTIGTFWCGWQFYTAEAVLPALKWGLTAVALAIMALQIKLALMPVMQANRVLLALRRLELHLTR
ncbi:MAG: hypothetical protein CR993_08795 [Rhodobacterales bacterium]|nr:MAG: hypothetical protein CR993_08795 [Rhodobacterales bacterium]